ncbi:MAG TPA: hypothetical protein DCY94_00775 [Firmicutes bacterium]|nr:hypothetical protein [Bacillota bacterium]
MDDDFLDVTENSHKIGIIFILVIIVILVCGYFFVFKKFYFSVKNIEVELGEKLSMDVKDYLSKSIKDTHEFKLDISQVNSLEVGSYNYTITHNGQIRKGKIKIVDTTAPVFTLRELSIEEGTEDFYLGSFLATCEDYSTPCIVTFKNSKDEEKLAKVGKHNIEIEVADTFGNKKKATAVLNVVKAGTIVEEGATDLEYASNSLNIEDFKGTVYKKLEKGILSGSEDECDIVSEISTVDLEKYVNINYPGNAIKESTIIKLYNKNSYTIGFSIQVKLSNGETIYIDPTKIGQEDISE